MAVGSLHMKLNSLRRMINRDEESKEFDEQLSTAALMTNNKSSEEGHASFSDRIKKMNLAEIQDFIIKLSYRLQHVEYQRLGEKIFVTSDINSINYILQRHSKDLVVFDIDDTLITFLDPFFDVHYLPNSALHQRLLAIDATKRDNFFIELFHTGPWTIIEPQTPRMIADFQERGVKVMALTALEPFIGNNFDSASWRVNHLRTLGYDFSKAFPFPLLYGFNSPKSKRTLEPYFKSGVMFSGKVPKGEALVSFLDAIGFKPKSVYFVDDSPAYIQSVYRELTRIGVECHCILYTRIRKHPSNSLFPKETYNSYLKKQETLIEELLRLEAAHARVIQAKEASPLASANPYQAMTWLAPRLHSSSLDSKQTSIAQKPEQKNSKLENKKIIRGKKLK